MPVTPPITMSMDGQRLDTLLQNYVFT